MLETVLCIEALCPGPLVFNAIRAVHPTTPILILGGHTHIRDCRKYRDRARCCLYVSYCMRYTVQLDGRSIALESGRYMETVGEYSSLLVVS
jgi:hypothetical protein